MQDNFKTQAFGFNKKEVMDYIFQLNNSKEAAEFQAKQKIAELEEQVKTLSENISRLEAENKTLSVSEQALKAELADSNEQKSRMYEEMNEIRRVILDNEREFNIKNEQISKLRAENEEYAEKVSKYSQIAENVGSTVMEAKKIASDIVGKANSKAEAIDEQTEKTIAASLGEIEAVSAEIDNFKKNVADMLRVCENRTNTLELNLKTLTDALTSVKKTTDVFDFDAEDGEDDTDGDSDGDFPPEFF